jgi:hypothetical protein
MDLKKIVSSPMTKWVIGILVIAAIVWYFKDEIKISTEKKQGLIDETGNATAKGKTEADKERILKKGSSGVEVSILQSELNKVYYSPPIKVDGKFGEETEARLMMLYKVNTVNLASLADLRNIAEKKTTTIGIGTEI